MWVINGCVNYKFDMGIVVTVKKCTSYIGDGIESIIILAIMYTNIK